MATQTFEEYSAPATYTFSFPSIQESDVKVRVDDVLKTAGTHYNINSYSTTGGGTVVFIDNSGSGGTNHTPSSGTVRIYRDTDVDSAKIEFTAGSSIRAEDLNSNQTQLLYRSQEEQIPNLIHSYDVDDSAVIRAKIAADAIDGTKIADDSIDSEHYVDGSIDTAHIADSQVTTAKIANDAVNNDKLADNSVNTAQLIDSAVSTNKIADDAVTAAKLANSINTEIAANTAKTSNATHTGEVTGATALTIANGAVVADRLATDSVTTAKIVDANVTHSKLANDAVDGDNIADNSINSEHYVDGSIDNVHIADGTIEFGKLAGGITSSLLGANSVTATQIADDTITSAKLTDATVITSSEQASATTNDTSFLTSAAADARFFNISTGDTIKDGDTFPDNDTTIATTAAINDRIIDLVDDVGGFVPIANETSFPTTNPDINLSGSAKGGTIVSVKAASTDLVPSGTTVTIANGRGSGLAVIITGVSATIESGFGFLVETTTTDHTYAFHRLVPKATEVTTVATNITNIVNAGSNSTNINTVAGQISPTNNISTVAGIATAVSTVATNNSNVTSVANNMANVNNFNDRYQIASSDPPTDGGGNALAAGDLYFNTSANELKVYSGSAWQGGVTATGSFATVTGNTFTGSNIHNDNVKSIYGTSSDGLEIFHNASNSVINDQGTGTLQLQTGGSTKLEVQSGGIEVTGNIVVSGTVDGVDIAALNTTVGNLGSSDVVSDTSPQLGGDLDVQAQQITTSTTNGNIKLTPNGTGVIEVKGAGGADGTLQLNCSANSHGVKIKSPPHSAAASYTLTLPDTDGSADQVLKTDGSGNLDWVAQTDTQLSTEQVQDIAGPLVATGGTKTGITVTYDDANGNMDFVVASQTDENFTTADHSKLDGIEAGATADQDANEILTLIKTVDGAGSGLDADTVDGFAPTSFLRSDANDSTSHHITFNDNAKVKIGTGGDLEIYHDGSDSYLKDGGTGGVKILTNNFSVNNAGDSENIIHATEDGSVQLYHDNTKRIETDGSGVTVTGNIAVTGTVDGIDIATDVAANTAKVTNATHTGEVTGSGALTIADNVVDEANLKVSNSPTNGYVLTAQSGNTGGLTWAEAGGGSLIKLQQATGADLGGALIFDDLDTATYRSFILNFAMVPASNVDGYYPNLRLRTGGSSGADETGSHYSFGYGYTYVNDGWQQIVRSDYSYVGLALTVGSNDGSEGLNGVIHITPCRSGDGFNTGSGGSYAHWQIGLHHEGGAWRGTHGNMVYNESSTTNHTGFKIYMGTGTSESGGFDEYKYTLYGLKD